MNLNNKCYFNVKHKVSVTKLNESQHLMVTTGLKAGGFTCNCGCTQTSAPQETVSTDITSPTIVPTV